jgi:hypothetical protein
MTQGRKREREREERGEGGRVEGGREKGREEREQKYLKYFGSSKLTISKLTLGWYKTSEMLNLLSKSPRILTNTPSKSNLDSPSADVLFSPTVSSKNCFTQLAVVRTASGLIHITSMSAYVSICQHTGGGCQECVRADTHYTNTHTHHTHIKSCFAETVGFSGTSLGTK